jgi:putative transcriptional regulator
MTNNQSDHTTMRHAMMSDYASGALSAAQTILMDGYIDLNETARAQAIAYSSVGGALLLQSDCDMEPVSDACFETLCESLTYDYISQQSDLSCDVLPQVILRYTNCGVSEIEWKKLAPGIEYFNLDLPLDTHEKAQLIKMQPGKSVLEHSHDGLELTLVLDGAFHDETGTYKRGDLAIEQGRGHAHAPVADEQQGCICFAVTSAPLHFTGLLGAMINPFVK